MSPQGRDGFGHRRRAAAAEREEIGERVNEGTELAEIDRHTSLTQRVRATVTTMPATRTDPPRPERPSPPWSREDVMD